MKVLNKLVLRNFFMNRKRTLVTIVGIMLSTALITTVASMAESLRASMIEYEKKYSGDFHYAFYNVSRENRKYFENNRNVESVGYISGIGYSILEGGENPDKPYMYLSAMDEAGMRAAGIELISGRLPENDSEVIISKHIRTNGGVLYKIGDRLILGAGERRAEGSKLGQSNPFYAQEEKLAAGNDAEYTVVGIIERPNMHIEPMYAPGYTVITYLSDKSAAENADIYATYTDSAIRDRDKVTASLLGVTEDVLKRYNAGTDDKDVIDQMERVASNYTCNIWLLKWQLMEFSDNTKGMLYGMAGLAILIIIFTSIFCIRNSFVISLTEKMKLYGMMSSIGATKKQRRRLVRGEAFLLGCIGIPLGLLLGTAATYIVVRCTSGLMATAVGLELVYVFSVPAMTAAVLLSIAALYFSAGKAARKAAKVSPIVAIRGNETVRIWANELRTPKIFKKLFGIGGAIAYKNLRRARVKYRTTVISIVVSVAVFIAMSTFTQLGLRASSIYYEELPYQISLSVFSKENYKDAMQITRLDGIQEYEVLKRGEIMVNINDIPFTKQYSQYISTLKEEGNDVSFMVASIGEEEYRQYCRKLGLSYDKVKDKGIVIADFLNFQDDGKRTAGIKYEYKPGDIIKGVTPDADTQSGSGTDIGENSGGIADMNNKNRGLDISIEVAAQTDVRPMGLYNTNKVDINGIIIVSDEWMDEHGGAYGLPYERMSIFIRCDDPDEIQKSFEEGAAFSKYNLNNEKQSYEQQNSMILLISVFLYGFIIVISLVGITNIFNTITTNMELRSREFAMLRSIGMTHREFRRMIWLESVFYGIKSLIIGIPIGVILSICFHKLLGTALELDYRLPAEGILLAVAAVFVLLFVITQYSMNKINRKNIVETIQNENI